MAQVSLNTRISYETNEALKKHIEKLKQSDPKASIAAEVEKALTLYLKGIDI